MIVIEPRTKCEVDAIKECIDLIRCGYFVLFSCEVCDLMIYKLKHRKNGRILTIRIAEKFYEIQEHFEILKHVDYPDEVVSD